LDNYTKGAVTPPENGVGIAGLFRDYHELSRVCSHPRALILASSLHSNKPPGVYKKGKYSQKD
jgi:hypothetical protein